jgi:hypothetical protein
MIKKMIAEVRAITGMYDYALFQHKRFKNKYKNSFKLDGLPRENNYENPVRQSTTYVWRRESKDSSTVAFN